jgi:hypothetical protein
MVLVHSAPTSLVRDHGRPSNLGVLSSPRCVYRDAHDKGFKWAADNDAYLAWDEDRFVRMLDKITGIPGCLFVAAPDVVGDAWATLTRFYEWDQEIKATGQPIAFVAQDGLEHAPVPWDDIDALFIGGSTDFKLGLDAAAAGREAKRRGKWLHMGRVNTRQRVKYAKSIGCDSVDGTNFSMYRQTNLPWALEWAAAPQQMGLVMT